MAARVSFQATVDQTVFFAPLQSAVHLDQVGIPLVRDAITNTDYGLDFARLQKQGRIGSTVCAFRALKGKGKTATNQMLGYRLGTRQVNGRRLKIAVDDHRTRKGEPEYEKLCRILGEEEVVLSRYRLNPLDMGLDMDFAQQLEWFEDALAYINGGQPLRVEESEALRYGLKKVRGHYPQTAEPILLAGCLRTLSLREAATYQQQLVQEAAERHQNDENYRSLLQQLVGTKGATPNTTPGLRDAALRVAAMVENLVDGRYGQIFGGGHALSEVLQRRITAWNYSELSDAAMPLVQSLLWRIKISAIAKDDHRFIPDIEFHDENPNMWRHLVYARSMTTYIKRIRSTASLLVLDTHREADYRAVGPAGSEVYTLATNMKNDIDVWWLGAMTREDAAEAQEQHGLSNKERDMLVSFNQADMVGNWLLKIGNEPVFPIKTILTPFELEMSASNLANDANYIDEDEGGETPWQSPNGHAKLVAQYSLQSA